MNRHFHRRLLPAATSLILLASAMTLVLIAPVAYGQDADTHPPIKVTDCKGCHTCETPTAETPCLIKCPRPESELVKEVFQPGEGPKGVIMLDVLSRKAALEDTYGPVPFDHEGHARWAEIAGGCKVCHHYTPEGAAHPACRTCHEAEYRHVDMTKPGLKGAYHRQCLNCHREWSHEAKCGTCHFQRVGNARAADVSTTVTEDDIIGTVMHPPIPEPVKEVYETKYPEGVGSKVYFHHARHSDIYGFSCAECHRGNSCERCHEPGKRHVQHVYTHEEHHKLCSACHLISDQSTCKHCHRQEGDSEPRPFTHASTGWPLGMRHANVGCRSCHKNMPFQALDPTCNNCHADWEPDNFDHSVTGQILNETHAEIDCDSCHVDRDFAKAPTCDECHDSEEVSFPDKRPGPWIGQKWTP